MLSGIFKKMYEEEDIGLKIPENEDEQFYMDLKEKVLVSLDTLKKEIKFQELILWAVESKLPKD